MLSPRNQIEDLFYLAVALSGNGQSAKSKLFTTSTSLIPQIKIRNSEFGRGSGRVLNYTSYDHSFGTKIQNLQFGRTGGRF